MCVRQKITQPAQNKVANKQYYHQNYKQQNINEMM